MIKTALVLTAIFIAAWLSPKATVDPWNLLSPKKILNLIFALAFIQAFGSLMIRILGARIGSILTGFFGGLISSTATTASLARKSRQSSGTSPSAENLIFLSATLAMLFEALAITIFGTAEIHARLFWIFFGPLLTTVALIIFETRSVNEQRLVLENIQLEILPLLKLSGFVVGILTVAKILQKVFGQGGLLVLTFIVSLFEIHGSVIANMQLHDAGEISVRFLGGLLAISIAASYLSKFFLITTLGSPALKKIVFKTTAVLFLSLTVSWAIFEMS